MAQTSTLLLHELITNAAKDGALFATSGRVRLEYLETRLLFNWMRRCAL
jgi:two-component sensor histidine kinase